MQASISWKTISILDKIPPLNKQGAVFKILPNPGLFRQFALPLNLSYVPYVLSPTVTYYHTIQNLLKREFGITVKEKKFPFRIETSVFGDVKINLNIRLYPPNISVIEIKVSEISTLPIHLDVPKLIAFQQLDRITPLNSIVKWTIGLSETLDHNNFKNSKPYSFKPALYVEDVASKDNFRKNFEQNLAAWVGILIRNNRYTSMGTNIVSKVLEKNREINEKTYASEEILVDKQGILYIASSEPEKSDERIATLSKVHNIVEYGLVIGAFLDQYLSLRATNEDFADFIFYKISSWISTPKVVFRQSISNGLLWALISDEFALSAQYQKLSEDSRVATALAEKSTLFDKFSTGWWDDKDFTYTLQKNISAIQHLDLSFLDNEELKKIILEDYLEAKRSFQVKNYKATILLCGSVAEAVLAAVIDKSGAIPTTKIYRDYDLGMSISKVVELGLLKDKSLITLLTPLREYRNLIHPGVQARKSLTPDEPKARISLETLKLLMNELNKAKI